MISSPTKQLPELSTLIHSLWTRAPPHPPVTSPLQVTNSPNYPPGSQGSLLPAVTASHIHAHSTSLILNQIFPQQSPNPSNPFFNPSTDLHQNAKSSYLTLMPHLSRKSTHHSRELQWNLLRYTELDVTVNWIIMSFINFLTSL